MGLFFVLVCIFLALSLYNNTLPEVNHVGTQINKDIKNIYQAPNP